VRRGLFLATGSAMLAGCSAVTNGLTQNTAVMRIIGSAEGLNHLVIGTRGSAQLFSERDVDRDFRVNGLPTPADSRYQTLVRENFASYTMPVTGKVERPQSFTLSELRALTSLNQITRHDCVEGWSAVGKFGGVPLAKVLSLVKPAPDARFVVFHCFDRDDSNNPYYESLNLHQAAHPQTVLALDLNDKPIDPDHGAPVRLKIPTQLGYKSAKWVERIELVANFKSVLGGKGGYWEDQGYEWYAGI
jgi:DMSO/TMAO reductase YedYZ molybdopterin-dependent catalytic subunit